MRLGASLRREAAAPIAGGHRPGRWSSDGEAVRASGYVALVQPSSKGAKISAARRGRAGRSDLGLTLPQAARFVGLSKPTFRELVAEEGAEGTFHGIPIREGRGTGWRFDPAQLEEDRARAPRCRCPVRDGTAGAYRPCGKVAGPSGRCGKHAARGEQQVELVCQYKPCGKRFTRHASWLAEQEGRGRYCTNECKGAAAYEARREDFRAPFTSEESRARQVDISSRIKASGKLDRYRAERSPLNLYGYSASHMFASGLGETTEIDGSPRWEVDRAELVAWEPPRATEKEWRVNIAYGRTKDPGVKGRLGGSIERKWTREQALEVLRLRAEGKTLGQIEYLTGLSKRQVRYILDG